MTETLWAFDGAAADVALTTAVFYALIRIYDKKNIGPSAVCHTASYMSTACAVSVLCPSFLILDLLSGFSLRICYCLFRQCRGHYSDQISTLLRRDLCDCLASHYI
jgi:hypothetical protein